MGFEVSRGAFLSTKIIDDFARSQTIDFRICSLQLKKTTTKNHVQPDSRTKSAKKSVPSSDLNFN